MNEERADNLIQRFFADEVTPELVEELDAWLREDPAHARLLAEYGLLEQLMVGQQVEDDASSVLSLLLEMEQQAQPLELIHAVKNESTQDDEEDAGGLSAQDIAAVGGYLLRKALLSKPAVFAYAAAVVLLAAVLLNPWGGDSDQQVAVNLGDLGRDVPAHSRALTQPIVATLTAERNAVWEVRPDTALAQGQRLTLTRGFAEFKTATGAIVVLQAPAQIELIDANALHLHTGRLVGTCATAASKGFLVKTDHIDIVDIGTRFGVQVTSDRVTTTVFSGSVELKTPGKRSEILAADQTAELSLDEPTQGLVVTERLVADFAQLLPGDYALNKLKQDPAMIAYFGFEAEDIAGETLSNRAQATLGTMNGRLGQPGKADSQPTVVEGVRPGTSALRFKADEFDKLFIEGAEAATLNGLEQFSIGMWVRPDRVGDSLGQHLVTRATPQIESLNLVLGWGRENTAYTPRSLMFYTDLGGQNYANHLTPGGVIPEPGTWFHVVATFDQGVRKLYVNGKAVGTLPSVGEGRLPATNSSLVIGASQRYPDDVRSYFDGDLDELFILGRAISAEEIAVLYGSHPLQGESKPSIN